MPNFVISSFLHALECGCPFWGFFIEFFEKYSFQFLFWTMLTPYALRLLKHTAFRTASCHCFASSSKTSATEDFLARVGRSRKTIAKQAAKPDAEFYAEKPEYPPITAPFEDVGIDGLKAEKKVRYVLFFQVFGRSFSLVSV